MAACVSELTKLIPLAGGTLAISLSYLNLERFRYATTLQESAKAIDDRITDENSEYSGPVKSDYEIIKYFASLMKNIGSNQAPDGIPIGKLWLFKKSIDVYICGAFAIMAGLALVLGSAHSIKIWLFTCTPFSTEWIMTTFIALLAGMIFPVMFVRNGNEIMKICVPMIAKSGRSLDEVQRHLKVVNKKLQKEVRSASLAEGQGTNGES